MPDKESNREERYTCHPTPLRHEDAEQCRMAPRRPRRFKRFSFAVFVGFAVRFGCDLDRQIRLEKTVEQRAQVVKIKMPIPGKDWHFDSSTAIY